MRHLDRTCFLQGPGIAVEEGAEAEGDQKETVSLAYNRAAAHVKRCDDMHRTLSKLKPDKIPAWRGKVGTLPNSYWQLIAEGSGRASFLLECSP